MLNEPEIWGPRIIGRGKGSYIEVAAQVALKLGIDDIARLFTIVELACVLPNRCTFPLVHRGHVG